MVKKYAIKGTSEILTIANTIAQTPCVVCANAAERDGVEVCAAADSLVRLTRIPEIMQDFLDGRCVCFERVV